MLFLNDPVPLSRVRFALLVVWTLWVWQRGKLVLPGAPGTRRLLPAGVAAFARLIQALNRGGEPARCAWSTALYRVSFVGLAASLYPYRVPPEMTLAGAAAGSSPTLVFMRVGSGKLLPSCAYATVSAIRCCAGRDCTSGRGALPRRGLTAATPTVPRMPGPSESGGY